MKKLLALLVLVAGFLLFGCASNPETPSVTPSLNASINATPTSTPVSCVDQDEYCGLGVSCCTGLHCDSTSGKCVATPTPTPTATPTTTATPTVTPLSCSLSAFPNPLNGAGQVLVTATFTKLPSTQAIIKCSESDSGLLVLVSSSTFKAIRLCDYNTNVSAPITYKLFAFADVLCNTDLLVNPPSLAILNATFVPGINFITLTWTTSILSDSRLSYGLNTTYSSSQNSSTNVTSHSMNVTGLGVAMTYYFKLTSCSTTCVEATYTQATSIDSSAPSVTLSSPADNAWVASSSVYFNYTPSDPTLVNCSFYNNASSWTPVATNSTPANASTNSFLASMSDGVFSWNIACMDYAGNRAFASSNRTVKIDSVAPSTPSSLAAANSTNATIYLTWTASTDATSGIATYAVFRNSTNVVNSSNAFYQDSGLAAASAFSYYVQAIDNAGNWGTASNTLQASTS